MKTVIHPASCSCRLCHSPRRSQRIEFHSQRDIRFIGKIAFAVLAIVLIVASIWGAN